MLLRREGHQVNHKRLFVDTSLSGLRVARELETLIASRSRPKMIVSDNVLYQEARLCFCQQVSMREFAPASC